MRRVSRGPDLTPYAGAAGLLLRNPTIIIVPLLAGLAAVLLRQILAHVGGGGLGGLTVGIGGFIIAILQLWGLGAACVHADLAWRRRNAPFDAAWAETQRKNGDILGAAVGVAFVVSLVGAIASILGPLAPILLALAAFGLIWTLPAAAAGGIPGMAALNASVERVRANPLPAGICTAVVIALYLLAQIVATQLGVLAVPLIASTPVLFDVIVAVVLAIAFGYAALVMTKTYTDASFGRRF